MPNHDFSFEDWTPGKIVRTRHNSAYHQGLHCLLSRNRSLEKEKRFFFQNFNLGPLSVLTLLYVTLWKIQFGLKGVET